MRRPTLSAGAASCARRRGLATLELVLSLPILLFVMALMINYGTAAGWKVRGLVAARHAGWSSRASRSPATIPRPQSWPLPPTATLGAGGGADATILDDPRIDQPVARGPSLPLGIVVNRDLLDPGLGMHVGTSHIERRHTLLQSLPRYALDSRVEMLDNKGDYTQTGPAPPYDWPPNEVRRIPALYTLAQAPRQFYVAYYNAVMAILLAPFKRDLDPLDRDDEFIGYSLRFRWGAPPYSAPDFHPRLPLCSGNCLEDKLTSAKVDDRVKKLVDEIQGRKPPPQPRVRSVAEKMAQAFVGLYQRVIQELKRQLQATPPPPADVVTQIQNEIAQLQAKIDVLEPFIATQP